jgi:hypothetical protein
LIPTLKSNRQRHEASALQNVCSSRRAIFPIDEKLSLVCRRRSHCDLFCVCADSWVLSAVSSAIRLKFMARRATIWKLENFIDSLSSVRPGQGSRDSLINSPAALPSSQRHRAPGCEFARLTSAPCPCGSPTPSSPATTAAAHSSALSWTPIGFC